MADPQETSDQFLNNLSQEVFKALKEILDIPLAPTESGFDERLKQRYFVVAIFEKFLRAAKVRGITSPKQNKQAIERAEIVAITAEKVEERRKKLEEKKAKLNGGLGGGG